jgi:hypothetical protein
MSRVFHKVMFMTLPDALLYVFQEAGISEEVNQRRKKSVNAGRDGDGEEGSRGLNGEGPDASACQAPGSATGAAVTDVRNGLTVLLEGSRNVSRNGRLNTPRKESEVPSAGTVRDKITSIVHVTQVLSTAISAIISSIFSYFPVVSICRWAVYRTALKSASVRSLLRFLQWRHFLCLLSK